MLYYCSPFKFKIFSVIYLTKHSYEWVCLLLLQSFKECWHFSFAVVQSLSHVLFFVTPWTVAPWTFLSFTISQSLLKLMSVESVRPSNHRILCCPLLLLPSSFPASGSFSMSRFFASDGQSLEASASVLPMNIQR